MTTPPANPATPRPDEAEPARPPAPSLRGVLGSERRTRAASPRALPRVALAHDWLVGRRGGELVLERLAGIVRAAARPAPLYTLFRASGEAGSIGPNTDALDAVVSPLNGWPRGARRWLLPMYPRGVRALGRALQAEHDERPIDLLLSTSSGLIKGLRAPRGVPHLCYCHAPARYLWGAQAEYTRGGGLGAALRRAGFGLFTPALRRWDERTVANVSRLVANSRHTAAEIERVWGRESTVVHPPVRTGFFTPDASVERQEFWLVVSALEPYKRVDLAIDAALEAGKRLMIAGTGSQAAALKAHAKATARRLGKLGMGARRDTLIEWLGRVDDEALRTLYRRAAVFLFPQVEDFGITAVEAQACGCPVVARRAGGALDTVLEGRTGALFDDAEPASVRKAVERLPSGAADQCVANARRFAEPAFDQKMTAIIASMLAR